MKISRIENFKLIDLKSRVKRKDYNTANKLIQRTLPYSNKKSDNLSIINDKPKMLEHLDLLKSLGAGNLLQNTLRPTLFISPWKPSIFSKRKAK